MSSMILLGLGMAAVGVAGRIALRTAPNAIKNVEKAVRDIPAALDSKAFQNAKYYKGGFEPKMTKREVRRLSWL